MARLHEYYIADSARMLSADLKWPLNRATDNNELCVVTVKVLLDFESNTSFISYYIPALEEESINIIDVFVTLINMVEKALGESRMIESSTNFPGEEPLISSDLRFSGRVFFYYEGRVNNKEEFINLRNDLREQNLFIHYRDMDYAEGRSAIEKPLAFISHDSRDKEAIANELYKALMKRSCPVWYDEYSLKLGDSLRESIEKGLKECKKCILILSPNFLSNPGWTKTEFNTIFTREIIETQNLVLPIWAGVDKRAIYEYSPTLVDRVGVDWNKGVDFVAGKIQQAVN